MQIIRTAIHANQSRRDEEFRADKKRRKMTKAKRRKFINWAKANRALIFFPVA